MSSERNGMEALSRYPLSEWRAQNRPLHKSETWRHVTMLQRASEAVSQATELQEAWEAKYSNRQLPEVDLVRCVSLYGFSRLLVQDWKEFPIEVPPDKIGLWREWGLGASLSEFRSQWQGGIAGGFLELAGRNPRATVVNINSRLQARYARLAKLLRRPDNWYNPATFTRDQRADGEDEIDNERIEEVFRLFQELTCFGYAFPFLHGYCITETDTELGLPNLDLYTAFDSVDVNELNGNLGQGERRLREILQYLVSKRHSVSIPTDPDTFWWRHQSVPRPGDR
jgi:hypothetical protein